MRVLALIHQEDATSGVFAEVAADLEEASFALGRPPSVDDHDAVMVFGGSMNVDEEDEHPWLREEKEFIRNLVAAGIPVLGVCLGSQLLAEAAGGRVAKLPHPEVGWHEVERTADDPVLDVMPPRFRALEWHGYQSDLPPGAVELARNEVGLQAFRLDDLPAWGIQFHAEVTAAGLAKWINDEDEPPAGLAAQSEREIARWNELGRRLCGAFLEAAASR
jgi:GMP synthase-like glutamine amidotransferase